MIRELGVTKADLVRLCLETGISVFGVDVLRREFTLAEVERIAAKGGASRADAKPKAKKTKGNSGPRKKAHTSPVDLAREFEVDVAEVLGLAKECGFARTNENRPLTSRQAVLIKERLIAREGVVVGRYSVEESKADANSDFAVALDAALRSRDSSFGRIGGKPRAATEYVATTMRLAVLAREHDISEDLLESLCRYVGVSLTSRKNSVKVSLRDLAMVDRIVTVLSEVRRFESGAARVRLSKIAKCFGVETRQVRDLCHAKGIPVTSERFVSDDHELVVLVLVHMKFKTGSERPDLNNDLGVRPEANTTAIPTIDYSSLSLVRQQIHDYDFSGSIMRNVDFAYSVLAGTRFRAANLEGSSFVRVDVFDSDFGSANLGGSTFDFSNLENVKFDLARLTGVSFRRATLKRCDFTRADLTQCSFEAAVVVDCRFGGANVVDTKWTDGTTVQSCEDLGSCGTT